MNDDISPNIVDLQSKYELKIYETLQEENKQLKLEVKKLTDKSQKYTNSEGHKEYYEKKSK